MKIYILITMLLVIAALFIVSERNVNLKTSEGRLELGKVYVGWMSQVLINARTVSGYVIKLDWLPKNSTD